MNTLPYNNFWKKSITIEKLLYIKGIIQNVIFLSLVIIKVS